MCTDLCDEICKQLVSFWNKGIIKVGKLKINAGIILQVEIYQSDSVRTDTSFRMKIR